MASKKKTAIEARVGHAQGIDDIAKEIGKAFNRYGAMRRLNHGVIHSASKAAKGKNSAVLNLYGQSYKSMRRAEKVSEKFYKSQKKSLKNMKKGAK
jgi:hypothetical protein